MTVSFFFLAVSNEIQNEQRQKLFPYMGYFKKMQHFKLETVSEAVIKFVLPAVKEVIEARKNTQKIGSNYCLSYFVIS